MATHPIPMGCVVKSRVIGMIHTQDQDGPDMKLICVPQNKIDPRRDNVNTIEDLSIHTQEELL